MFIPCRSHAPISLQKSQKKLALHNFRLCLGNEVAVVLVYKRRSALARVTDARQQRFISGCQPKPFCIRKTPKTSPKLILGVSKVVRQA